MPADGHLIALGVLHAVGLHGASPEQVANAKAYGAEIAATGRFLTFAAGAAAIGYRLREDPGERAALKIGMHTSPAFAEASISAPTTALTSMAIAQRSSSQ